MVILVCQYGSDFESGNDISKGTLKNNKTNPISHKRL
jgi:hypothetical protein